MLSTLNLKRLIYKILFNSVIFVYYSNGYCHLYKQEFQKNKQISSSSESEDD